LANLEYRGHLISVSVVYDTAIQFLFTPVAELRPADSKQVLSTILTHRAFVLHEEAIEFGFILGREWVDKRLAEI
jgi:hypothetical protein